MIGQYIKVGSGWWNILIYYDVCPDDFLEIEESLLSMKCPLQYINDALHVMRNKNTGFTFTNSDIQMSMVCISRATSLELFISTAIHEIDHVQSHICLFYKIDMNTEDAAYLIGHIARKMYKILKLYV